MSSDQHLSDKEALDIAESSCIFEVHVRQPGFKKKMSSYSFLRQLDALERVEASVISVSKELIQKIDLAYLETQRSDYLANVKAMAVNAGGLHLGNGQHLVKLSSVQKLKDLTTKFEKERQVLLDHFEADYDRLKAKAKGLLKEFYSDADFPDFKFIRSRYSVESKFISNRVPDELRKVSEKIYQEEKVKRAKEMREVAQEAQTFLRTSAFALIESLVSSIGMNPETGKFRRLPEAKIKALQEFIQNFYAQTLTPDPKLQELLDKAKEALGDMTLTEMSTDLEFRQEVSETFNQLLDDTASSMTEVKRAIRPLE